MKLKALLALCLTVAASSHLFAQQSPITLKDKDFTAHTLLRAGERLQDGSEYLPDNDRVSYFPIDNTRAHLLIGHELHYLNEEQNGAYSRLTIDKDRHKILDSQLWFKGMHNFCSGGSTLWNTLLSGEEYPTNAFNTPYKEGNKRYTERWESPRSKMARFGWVYEIDPFAKSISERAVRRTALGRFSHEGIVVHSPTVVYMTEDFVPGYFFKFEASRPQDLREGQLYAYQKTATGGRWLPVNDVYNARLAAKKAGATPFNKLEDMVKGKDGMLYLSESGSSRTPDAYGRILRFDPARNTMKTFIEGDGKRFANPDNLAVDPVSGKLLICEDQDSKNRKRFGSNDVWWADASGKLTRFATMHPAAEPSGPTFTPDGKTLFLSVISGENSALLQLDRSR